MKYVYLLGWVDGPIKVGLATSVDGRLGELQTACPYELVVHAAWPLPWARAVEIDAQRQLTVMGKKLSGEWFQVSVETAIEVVCQSIADVALRADLGLPEAA